MSQFLAAVIVLLAVSSILFFLYTHRESKLCQNSSYNYLKLRCNCPGGLGGTYCNMNIGDKVAFSVNSPGGLPNICSPDTVSVLVFTGTIRSFQNSGAIVDFDSVNVINPSSADPNNSCNKEPVASFYKGSDATWNATYLGSSDNPGTYYKGIIPTPTIPFKSLMVLDKSVCNSNGFRMNNDQCVCVQGHSLPNCA